MQARVFVTLREGILDPQGEAVHQALNSLGFDGVSGVRQGKVMDLDLADGTSEAEIGEMCEKLLANTVIENYDYKLVSA
jgi:phosphoribosylformylglycinamidine synthase